MLMNWMFVEAGGYEKLPASFRCQYIIRWLSSPVTEGLK
jgi:hypothetical protein